MIVSVGVCMVALKGMNEECGNVEKVYNGLLHTCFFE